MYLLVFWLRWTTEVILYYEGSEYNMKPWNPWQFSESSNVELLDMAFHYPTSMMKVY